MSLAKEIEIKFLTPHYVDLEWIDDASDFRCERCRRVMIQHYITNCGHRFCQQCKIVLGDGVDGRKCPQCTKTITKIADNDDLEFKKNVLFLNCFCPNKIQGCTHQDTLRNTAEHFKGCRIREQGIRNNSDKSKELRLKQEISSLKGKFEKLSNRVESSNNTFDKHQDELQKQVRPTQNLEKPSESKILMGEDAYNSLFQAAGEISKANIGNAKPLQQTIPQLKLTSALQKEEIPQKTYNVLLLGPTGVGKSTFINAFGNYLKFKDIADAKENPEIKIHGSFTIQDKYLELKTVGVGVDPNEKRKAGQPATQHCRAHKFQVEDYSVRFIDTPGVLITGDSIHDMLITKQMMEKVVKFLSEYEELHAICFLVKPDGYWKMLLWRNFIVQILSQLHKNAKDNIIFMCTNTRGTGYKPGNEMNRLQAILSQVKDSPPHCEIPFNNNNTFCFDNEAFIFLLALKNKIFFNEKNIKCFEESWKRSASESQRLMKYILGGEKGQGLTPHVIKESMVLNKAKNCIAHLYERISEYSAHCLDLQSQYFTRQIGNMKVMKTIKDQKEKLIKYATKLDMYVKQNAIARVDDVYKELFGELNGRGRDILSKSGIDQQQTVELVEVQLILKKLKNMQIAESVMIADSDDVDKLFWKNETHFLNRWNRLYLLRNKN